MSFVLRISSRGSRQWAGRILCLSAWLAAPVLPAHDSPEHVIAQLSGQITRRGESAELLCRRGTEHRVLYHLDQAVSDFLEAIKLDPHHLPARRELGRIYLEQGKIPEAIECATRALAAAHDPGDCAPFHMIRAEAYSAAHDDRKALADCNLAFAASPAELDWYLIRSQIQGRLGQWQACCDGLKKGLEETGSAMLEIEWIEALLDARRAREALPEIERQLAESHWRSSWLLRRARARLALGEKFAARQDLQNALSEINRRLTSPRPDLALLADRGFAFALLGDKEAAEKDLHAAQQLGADEWVLRRLQNYLKPPTPGR